ncbi:DgyrCDS14578 [Dimorphilus gyrociliatus]|uniref:DgyrCDS14578 n=1 Tax=Dimorphilus gyrociliatus TaxID=2664684 RepID=A0A7I8WE43_9ANNE|nr:DgyrCDS14578 [Dimorphilus gyrociliatus]
MNSLARRLFSFKRIAYLQNYNEYLKTKSNVERAIPVVDGMTFRGIKDKDIPRVAQLITDAYSDDLSIVVGRNNLRYVREFWIKTLNYDNTVKNNFLITEINNEVKGLLKLQDFAGQEKGLPISETLKIFPLSCVGKFVLTGLQLEITSIRSEMFEPYIDYVTVDPKARGQKIAYNVMQYCEYIAEKRGAKRVSLIVNSDNTKAINLYLKLGYIITYEIKCPKYLNAGHQINFKMEKYL